MRSLEAGDEYLMMPCGMYPTVPPYKTDYDRGRDAGLGRAQEICEEYAKATLNSERAKGAEILAKDIKREIERE